MIVTNRAGDEAASFVAGDVGAIACLNDEHRLDRVRAFVKIQDGCSFSCAFCVIPLVRGGTRSRTADAVLGEIRRRVAQGHREIVLTGVNLGCFRDRGAGYTLARLVRAAGAIPGLERLRLSSLEVNHVDDELVAALEETPTVSPICTCRCSPAMTTCSARWAAGTRPPSSSAGSRRSPTST